MEYQEARTFGRHVTDGTDEAHHVGQIFRSAADEGSFGRLAVVHLLATVHVGHVHRTEPVGHGIHAARSFQAVAHLSLDVDRGVANGAFLHAVGDACQRGQMSARRESRDAYERSVEAVFVGMGAHKANGGLHVVNLCRKLGVATRAVVDAYHGKARVGERLAQRHIGHHLHVVGKPCAAVDGNHHFVFFLLLFGQVDVHAVGIQVVARIVDVLVGCLVFRHLESAESLWLSCGEGCHAEQ